MSRERSKAGLGHRGTQRKEIPLLMIFFRTNFQDTRQMSAEIGTFSLGSYLSTPLSLLSNFSDTKSVSSLEKSHTNLQFHPY